MEKFSYTTSETIGTIRSIDITVGETNDELIESLEALSKSSNLESLCSTSNVLRGIVTSISNLNGSANDIILNLSSFSQQIFTTITGIVSGLSLLAELPEEINNLIRNAGDSLNAIFTVSSVNSSSDSLIVNAVYALSVVIDAINAIIYIASTISENINNEIATAVVTLLLVLTTTLSFSETVLVVGAAANGITSTRVTDCIDAVKLAVRIVLNALGTTVNNSFPLASLLSGITSLLTAAITALVDGAGQIINVKHVPCGIISGFSSKLSTIAACITDSLDDVDGGIISGICGISGGIGGAVGDLVQEAARLWGFTGMLKKIVHSLSGIIDTSAASVGDVTTKAAQ